MIFETNLKRRWGVLYPEMGRGHGLRGGPVCSGAAQTEDGMLSLGAFWCRYPNLTVEHAVMKVLNGQIGMGGELGVVELFA